MQIETSQKGVQEQCMCVEAGKETSKYSKFHSMIEPLLSPSSNQKDKWPEGSAVIGHSKGLTKYNTEESISKIEKI